MSDFINTDLFPKMGAQSGFEEWLREISKSAGIEDFDPVLKPKKDVNGNYVNDDGTPYTGFDYTQTIPPFYALSAVGDPRFSMGHMLSAAINRFFPIIDLYTEVAQVGGCQVIDEYICDEQGIPIKKATSTCPPNIDFVQPVKSEDVINFVTETYNAKILEDVKAFTDYITKNFINNGYTIRLLALKILDVFSFLVEAKKPNDVRYFKYYSTEKEKISEILNIPITYIDTFSNDAVKDLNINMFKELSVQQIPQYSGL